MSLLPLHYQVVGQDDYSLDIRVETSGSYRIDWGDHASHKPKQGQLTASQRAELESLIRALDAPLERPAPEGATGFVAELRIGAPPEVRIDRIWEGDLAQEPRLMALIRALEVL